MGGIYMEKIRSLIGETIKLAGEQYQKSKRDWNEDSKYHEKQRAQAKYFNLTKDELSGLKIDKDIVKGVHFNNLSYCLKKFLQEEAEIIEATNLEWHYSWEHKSTYPVTSRLETQLDVFVEIWTEATVFFKWKGNAFCVSISIERGDSGGYEVSFAAKEWEILREFTKTF